MRLRATPALRSLHERAALMHHGDNLLDTGPLPRREAAWAAWEEQVRAALRTGAGDDPLLRTLVHTVRAHPRLRENVAAYLSTATAELHFTGFAAEADFQAYVDAYSYPAFMLAAGVLAPEATRCGTRPPAGRSSRAASGSASSTTSPRTCGKDAWASRTPR
ncbi:hypothetical protein A6P39_012045 [Streptomyces sp. FXJ1.172]|uniref:hypothetical protein n=1 Tax=Streptomyces sp. FXJ1.172 TaxID=710705 RepID=UPI0013312D42